MFVDRHVSAGYSREQGSNSDCTSQPRSTVARISASRQTEERKERRYYIINLFLTKSMGFQGKGHMRTNIAINGKIIEQVRTIG